MWPAALTVQGEPGGQRRVGLRAEVALSVATFQVIVKVYLLRVTARTDFS